MAFVARAAAPEPVLEGLGGEGGDLALGRNTGRSLCQAAEHGGMGEHVDHAGQAGGEAGPPGDQAHAVGAAGPQAAGVVVREELGLVGGYIYLDRALTFAALAGQAEVQRLLDVRVAPAVVQGVTLQHLEEQAGASAGRVFFLARHHIAGTHGAGMQLTAPAHAHAAQGRVRKAALIVGEREMRAQPRGTVRGAEAQILVEAIGVHQLAGVHLPVGIPDGFELTEGPNELRPIHLRQ